MTSAMQIDTTGVMGVDHPEDDQDSLFGSPPSSPIRGRSPSPALALPSASFSTQNVGTIALPGSHHYSELPVNPLALSLSHAHEHTHRPPAISTRAINPYLSYVRTPAYSSPSWSRASSAAPSSKPKKKQSKKSNSKESTPRPPAPEIPLPDPSDPPPANFLRNQSGLLGTAGLVGGIKPANLSVHRHTRGANASNPIVVEDEEEPPILGRSSKFRHPYTHPVDTCLLPTPTTQDVVAMLIGQKDIFPVLESILRLIASGSGPQATGSGFTSFRSPSSRNAFSRASTSTMNTPSSAPPPKKRKLNRVPAGAVDWDVPYPFSQGEGPDAYRTTWERERGKQLISQLVTLIKSAARKAATRLFLQNEEAKRAMLESRRAAYAHIQESSARSYAPVTEVKVHGHYRPSTVTYGLEGEAAANAKAQAQEVLADASNGITRTSVASAPSPYQPSQSSARSGSSTAPQPSTPFDQLITSLLAAAPDQSVVSSGMPVNLVAVAAPELCENGTTTGDSTTTGEASTSSAGQSNGNIDQGLFDNWMNILQTFPIPSEGFSRNLNPSQPSTSPMPTNDDFGFFDLDPNFDFDMSLPSIDSLTTSMLNDPPNLDSNHDTKADQDKITPIPHVNDHLIDPSLLAISIPQTYVTSSGNNSDVPPSLAASPIPSTSGDPGPPTPSSATWDLSVPDVVTATHDESLPVSGVLESVRDILGGGLEGQGMWGRALRNVLTKTQQLHRGGDADEYIHALLRAQGKDGGKNPKQDKGKGRDMGHVPPTSTIQASMSRWNSSMPSSYHAYATSYPGLVTSTSVLQTVLPTASEKPLNKDDIMRRAVERRKELTAEIVRVKTQLWETTIEQGVLTHMSKSFGENAQ